MKESFSTYGAAEDFLKNLAEEKKFLIGMRAMPTGEYQVEWQEHKDYVAQDGKSYPDEVWFTEDQRMILVQDLEPEHARNILRMMLRQEREMRDRMESLLEHIVSAGEAEIADDLMDDAGNIPAAGTMLH